MGTGAFAEWSDVARFVVLGEPVLPRGELAPVYAERYGVYRALYPAL